MLNRREMLKTVACGAVAAFGFGGSVTHAELTCFKTYYLRNLEGIYFEIELKRLSTGWTGQFIGRGCRLAMTVKCAGDKRYRFSCERCDLQISEIANGINVTFVRVVEPMVMTKTASTSTDGVEMEWFRG